QGRDFAALQTEGELQDDGAPREVTGDSAPYGRHPILLLHAEMLNRVLILGGGLRLPPLDRGEPYVGVALILDHGIIGETTGNGRRVHYVGRKILRNGLRKIDAHLSGLRVRGMSPSLRASAH